MNSRLIPSFPKNGEGMLISVFNFQYRLGLLPFKIHYDPVQERYVIRVARSLQVLFLIRAFLQIIMLVHVIQHGFRTKMDSMATGPMKVFFTSSGLGTYLISFIYFASFLSKNRQQAIAKICNLIKQESLTQQHSNYRQETVPYMTSQTLVAVLHSTIGICVLMFLIISQDFAKGFEAGLKATWYIQILGEKIPENNQNDFTLWKKVISLTMKLVRCDLYMSVQSTQMILLFAAKTLEASSFHFVMCTVFSQTFCMIKNDQIFVSFCKLRKLFIAVNETFRWLTLVIVVSHSVSACVSIVWAFLDSTTALALSQMLVQLIYFAWFLLSSAKASNQLKYLSRLLTSRYSYRPDAANSSLQKLLMTYEVKSGSIGMAAFDIITVTYGFIGALVVSMLSNCTIVLQSMDILNKMVTITQETDSSTNNTSS